MAQEELRNRAKEIRENWIEILIKDPERIRSGRDEEVNKLEDELMKLQQKCQAHPQEMNWYGNCDDCGYSRHPTVALPPTA